MKPVVIASNMRNEIDQLEGWMSSLKPIADGGMLVVDTGSTDGTIEHLEKSGVTVIVDDIIRREGYGPARNHLREMAAKHFPDAHWCAYFDADERMDPAEYHHFRFYKDYLVDNFDVIAFPRIDWMDDQRSAAAKDWHLNPDYQARMTRIHSPLKYVRRLHEQIVDSGGILAQLNNPKIHHFHRSAGQAKRDAVGKLCAYLHEIDEMGGTYPEHHKEAYYRKLLEREGL